MILPIKTLKSIQLSSIPTSLCHRLPNPTLLSHISYSFASTQPNSHHKINYTPIRPLKKGLTPLYQDMQFLNQGIINKISYWPFFSPFFAMLINNFLTQWTLINSAIASVLFTAGLLARISTVNRLSRQVLKFECSNDLSKIYLTLPTSTLTQKIVASFPKNYSPIQQTASFTQNNNKTPHSEPSQEKIKTFSEDQINKKNQQFEQKVVKDILKEKHKSTPLARFELERSKCSFKLSNLSDDKIAESQIPETPNQISTSNMFDVKYKYLIIRSHLRFELSSLPLHFYLNLEQNGDPKYHDYLTALGANFNILLEKD